MQAFSRGFWTVSVRKTDDDDDDGKKDLCVRLNGSVSTLRLISRMTPDKIFHSYFVSLIFQVTEKELKIMFMKIDTNCDENVSWSEYVSFILCELQKKDLMRSSKHDNPLPSEITNTVMSKHHNYINRSVNAYTSIICMYMLP